VGSGPDRTPGPDAARLGTYGAVATALALLSDRRLRALVDAAPRIAEGIGGTTVRLDVEGTPVFVKRVPLTDLERRPENVLSTANLFRLPTFFHYGVGSAGGGAWRELAAHAMTTNWVLAGRSGSFPMLYHWRVLTGPRPAAPSGPDRAELDRMVEYWAGSPAVRERLTALAGASAGLLLFLEHVPHTVHEWLTAQVTAGTAATEAAAVLVERRLPADVRFMTSAGLLHFDAHFGNVLTDGRRLYLTDFGLACSPRFELSAAEAAFLDEHRDHDACYAVTELVNWLVVAVAGAADRPERVAYIRRCATGEEPAGVPPAVAAIIRRYAPIAAVMNDFYGALYLDSRATPYPAAEIRRVCAQTAFPPT
jgi:hypothetical protein